MLCLTCTMISSVDLANHGVASAKDWVSVDCGTNIIIIQANGFIDQFADLTIGQKLIKVIC